MRSAGVLLLRAICLYLLLVIADVPIVCADERLAENAPATVTAGSDGEAATLANAGRAVLLKHKGPTGDEAAAACPCPCHRVFTEEDSVVSLPPLGAAEVSRAARLPRVCPPLQSLDHPPQNLL